MVLIGKQINNSKEFDYWETVLVQNWFSIPIPASKLTSEWLKNHIRGHSCLKTLRCDQIKTIK